MSAVLDRIRREPALVTGLVSAVVALVTSFGLHLTDEQVGAITAVTIAVMALVTRSQVTPTAGSPAPRHLAATNPNDAQEG